MRPMLPDLGGKQASGGKRPPQTYSTEVDQLPMLMGFGGRGPNRPKLINYGLGMSPAEVAQHWRMAVKKCGKVTPAASTKRRPHKFGRLATPKQNWLPATPLEKILDPGYN